MIIESNICTRLNLALSIIFLLLVKSIEQYVLCTIFAFQLRANRVPPKHRSRRFGAASCH
jgi:hypothetical protein